MNTNMYPEAAAIEYLEMFHNCTWLFVQNEIHTFTGIEDSGVEGISFGEEVCCEGNGSRGGLNCYS